jgi:hypothetical protein
MATEIPFRVIRNSLYIKAGAAGQPCLFILDTGDAIGPVFNSADAERLDLKATGVIGVSGAGGATENYGTETDIMLGDLTFQGEPGAIDPYLQGPSLLGLPFFLGKARLLTFDFTRGILAIEPK